MAVFMLTFQGKHKYLLTFWKVFNVERWGKQLEASCLKLLQITFEIDLFYYFLFSVDTIKEIESDVLISYSSAFSFEQRLLLL